MAEFSARDNPLYDDPALFDMYMRALDDVLADSEIRGALDEFRGSRHKLRASMVTDARRVLETTREFAEYEALRTRLVSPSDSGVQATVSQRADELSFISRMLAMGIGAIGLVFVVVGMITTASWRWLMWPGAALLTVAALLAVSVVLLVTKPGLRLFGDELIRGIGPELGQARERLMAAIGQEELTAQVRTFINMARQDHFGHAYSVRSISGLSEIYDTTYQVPTSTAAELGGLLARLDGASIGVAGPRGSGKSTLIRGYCDEGGVLQAKPPGNGWRGLLETVDQPEGGGGGGDLRCMVSAPVDYAARDFVLHLFAVFCRGIIRRHDGTKAQPSVRSRMLEWLGTVTGIMVTLFVAAVFFALPAAVSLHWQHTIANFLRIPAEWIFYAALALVVLGVLILARKSANTMRRARARTTDSKGEILTNEARLHLERVRYLQTFTSGWSGTLSLPGGGQGQHSRGHARAEQPLSYPEIVGEFRAFARDVAAEIHRNGDRVFIGIDELDKIGAPENAERFLNEIKGIFGIPHLYFMVSVSDDALTAFERRGLPLRDAFDSSFDEIIHVGPLSYAESRRLLYRRVIGLTEPYVALCHCLAGGLARDLIRAARQVIRGGETLIGNDQSLLGDNSDFFVDSPGTFRTSRKTRPLRTASIGAVCAAVVQDEIRRKARAVAYVANSRTPSQAQDLQDALYAILRHLVPGAPAIKIVDIACQTAPGESAAVTRLRLDFAAYAYFCATLQEIFNEHLDTERMVKATSTSPEPGTFDALANARHAFTLDTQLAWRSITQFRQAWSLETREPIKEVGET